CALKLKGEDYQRGEAATRIVDGYPSAGRGRVYRIQSVEQERGPNQAESGRTAGAAKRSTVGGGLSEAESEVARLAAVLPLREHKPDVYGSQWQSMSTCMI